MSSSSLFQQLWDLDESSPYFHTRLVNTLLAKDCMDQIQELSHEDLIRLIEGLDHSLNALKPAHPAFDQCLFELRRICGTRKVLPTSHIIPCALSDVSNSAITSGVFADVYEGTLERTKVRVKKVRKYFKDDPEKLKLFYHEAVVWKRINHPNIVPFRGATLDPPQLVSDWMEHGSLPSFLERQPKANRLGLLHDVAEALNYIHSCNLVHGSIQGTNILVDRFCRARVADFSLTTVHPNQLSRYGVSELRDHDTRWTAPEISKDTGPLTNKADVFSFAMVMVEVFTDAVPFNNFQSVTSIMKTGKGERPPRPTDPTLPNDVWELMQDCWQQDPQSRPEMRVVLQSLAPSLLRCLHQSTKSLPEFQVALSQFYDSTERKSCISRLRDGELKDFVDFLDDVLLIKGLNKDLLQRTLYNLREVCGERTILSESSMTPCQFSKSTDQPRAVSGYAKVWSGQTIPGEGNEDMMDVCIKVIKSEKILEEFYGDIALWTKLDHPNILGCFGVMVDNPQIVMEWMPNGEAMKYVQKHRRADRVCLLIDIVRGLDYLHSHGVIHGNLKQRVKENILVDSAGHARLSDIGFARLMPAGELNFDWAQVGAAGCRWAAPEIFQKGEFTTQSDVFSYGFVAAEILTGNFLWEDIDSTNVRSRILRGDRPHVPEYEKNGTLIMGLWGVFAGCWGKDPASRILASEALNVLQYLPRQRSGSHNSEAVTTQGKVQSGQEDIEKLDKMLDTGLVPRKQRPKLLNSLCKMCDTQRSLPQTMVIGQDVLTLRERELPQCNGGFGDVYKSEYDGRVVAIKVARLCVTSDLDHYLSMFCREAVTWRHLRHPNILPLLGATLEMEDVRLRYGLVSEWMDNGDINNFVKTHGDVNRVQLLVDAAHGLEYLHSLDFVHGDLKGRNILIKKDSRACLADFGLSTIAYVAPYVSNDISLSTEAPADSVTSLMRHTHGYTEQWTSPELLNPEFGESRPTKQSDCYAFGMVVYEVLCGKKPYGDKRYATSAILDGVRPSKPDAAATLGFTDGLWWDVKCCWLEDPSARPDVKMMLGQLNHAAWAWDRRR